MQYVTEDYRNNMALPFRGASSVYAYIGLINRDAQRYATITSSYSGSEAHLYDGSGASTVTSTESNGSMTFTFGDFYELNIAGLTISFVTIPSSITVTNGDKTETYSVGGKKDFSFDDGYKNCHYLTITPSSGKLKINSIQFGIGLQFGNRQILNSSRTNIVDHISSNLPEKRFTLKINNRSKEFNKDNPYGYADYFEEKQEVIYEYGRELTDGTIYKIKGGNVLLKDWISDDYEATFNCVGHLDYLEGEYYKGQVYEDGISAYNLAENVLTDAGVTKYVLDETMKGMLIYNPIPVCEYKEALQLIANACCGTLYEDRDGNICIKCENGLSFIQSIEFYNGTDYSLTASLIQDNTANNYGDAEINYLKANSQLLFLPENSDFIPVGFVSNTVANSSGRFSATPRIVMNFVSEFVMNTMYLTFGVVAPTSFTITSYLADVMVDTQTFSQDMKVMYDYVGAVDKVEIVFNGATPNQRIHLNTVELKGKIAYELTYHDLKDPPVASSLERVSKIHVVYYEFSKEVVEEGMSRSSYVDIKRTPNEDGGDTLSVSSGSSMYGSAIATIQAKVGENVVKLTSPYYNYKASAGTITESGAYYVVVESDSEQEISIYGQPYTSTQRTATIQVHEKGVEKTCENVLVNTEGMANRIAKWLRDFYDNDVEYSLTYRGDPTLDADDMIYLENQFVANNMIRITQETINTSMGMDFSCGIQGRRTSYQVNSKVDEAIMGDFLIGEDVL